MRLRLSVLLALVLLAAVPVGALTPHLVKDINLIPSSAGSDPQGYVTVGGVAFFTAFDSLTGRELYRTDGTPAGTFQVVDACPGPCIGGPSFVAQNGKSYFFTAESAGAGDLWVSGGLPANTFRLTDGLHLPGQGIWIASQGVLYFAANDGIHGMELWRTDGTLAGTHLAVDVRPGPAGSNPNELTDFNGRLFFRADDGRLGPSLWKSDGTPAGTQAVRDPIPSSAVHSGPTFLRAVGRTLFFIAPVKSRGFQLWKSDGTTAGTAALTNARFSPARPFLDFAAFGNRLMFVAQDPKNGEELWISDGTAGGTKGLTNLPRADAFSLGGLSLGLPLTRFSLGNRYLFRAADGPHGIELWTTDGTPKGTRMVQDLCPGFCRGAFSDLVQLGGRVFFTGKDATTGFEPWSTDGTAAGTRKIRDLCAGDRCFRAPTQWRTANGKAFFVRREDVVPYVPQLWSTDGTAQGTVQLTDFTLPGVSDDNFQSAVIGGRLLFTADGAGFGAEPWISDGTPQGTRLAVDVNVDDVGGSRPNQLRTAGGKVYFFADDGEHGADGLWTSDGTEAGTRLVSDLFPEGLSRPPAIVASAEAAGRFFFVLALYQRAPTEYQLWRTDGTAAGTVRLLPEGEARLSPYVGLTPLGNEVFFAASDGVGGDELWKTDGTVAGTRMIVDLDAGAPGSSPQDITAFQGKLYFSAAVGEAGRELWRSDGTPGGTFLVKDIDPRPRVDSRPNNFVEHAGRLYFVAFDDQGARYWTTDGTPAGTVPLDLIPEPGTLFLGPLIPLGSKLLFFLSSDVPRHGLWVTDLTAAGTRRISDVLLGGYFDFAGPAVFNGRLYFSGSAAPTYHVVLWTSDGTEAGTAPMLDREGRDITYPLYFRAFANRLFFTTQTTQRLYASDGTQAGTAQLLQLVGPPNFSFFELAPAGSHLFFQNWDRDHGFELWGLEGE